jgi:hypothetical protein
MNARWPWNEALFRDWLYFSESITDCFPTMYSKWHFRFVMFRAVQVASGKLANNWHSGQLNCMMTMSPPIID